jgi:hypothetical protein
MLLGSCHRNEGVYPGRPIFADYILELLLLPSLAIE